MKKFRLSSIAAVFLAGASLPALAGPQDVAVIIGNQTYKNDLPAVDFAHRDADAMRHYVTGVLGYEEQNIIDLRDASKAEIEAVFGNERSYKGRLWQYIRPDGSSDVTVYYSGHGAPGLSDGNGYLLPIDANADRAEINGYPLDLLYRNLGRLDTQSVTVLLDACFSGESAGGPLIAAASPAFIRPQLPGTSDGLTVLTAASGTQLASWDLNAGHGLFTHHLLDALYGMGDRNADGKVSAAEAKFYLDDKMTYAARRHFGREQVASLYGDQTIVLSTADPNGVFAQRPALQTTVAATEPTYDRKPPEPVEPKTGSDPSIVISFPNKVTIGLGGRNKIEWEYEAEREREEGRDKKWKWKKKKKDKGKNGWIPPGLRRK